MFLSKRKNLNLNKTAAQNGWNCPELNTLHGSIGEHPFRSVFEDKNIRVFTELRKKIPGEISFYLDPYYEETPDPGNQRKTGDKEFDNRIKIECKNSALSIPFCTPAIRDFLSTLTTRFFKIITIRSNHFGIIIDCEYKTKKLITPHVIKTCISALLELGTLILDNPNSLTTPEGYIYNITSESSAVRRESTLAFFREFYNSTDLENYQKNLISNTDSYIKLLSSLFLLEKKEFKAHLDTCDFIVLKDFINLAASLDNPKLVPKLIEVYKSSQDKIIKEKALHLLSETGGQNILDFMFSELQYLHERDEVKSQCTDNILEIVLLKYLTTWGGTDVYDYLRDYTNRPFPEAVQQFCAEGLQKMKSRLLENQSDYGGRLSFTEMAGPQGGLSVFEEVKNK